MLVIVTAVIITKQVNSSGKRCSKKMQQKSRLVMFSHLLLIVLQHSVSLALVKISKAVCSCISSCKKTDKPDVCKTS